LDCDPLGEAWLRREAVAPAVRDRARHAMAADVIGAKGGYDLIEDENVRVNTTIGGVANESTRWVANARLKERG